MTGKSLEIIKYFFFLLVALSGMAFAATQLILVLYNK